MLLSLGHGQKIVKLTPTPPAALAPPAALSPDSVPSNKVTGHAAPPTLGAGQGRFGYLFGSAVGPSHAIDAEVLDRLADAMIDQGARPDIRAIAPIFTYFGQFIDHDITANTDGDLQGVAGMLKIDQPVLRPVDRSLVVSAVTNLRNATLQLDSLYGDGPVPTGLEAALRDGAKMRLGGLTPVPPPEQHQKPPNDGLADLPRVGTLVTAGVINAADVPAELLSGGPAKDSRKALIGDNRNDENLIVAQLHVAFLRFHNAVLAAQGGGTTEAAFKKAQALVRHTYQWLVINAYLPAVADQAVINDVIAGKAPLYAEFYEARKAQIAAGELPMPLEFSVAAFRYGHSLIRARYDYNVNFTGPRAATFEQLFAFTGNAATAPIGGFNLPTLPNNWPIDWSRFLGRATDPDFRFARAIDTALAPPLSQMVNQGAGVFQHLARRNLRRGWILNLPTAQTVGASMTAKGHPPARMLSEAEIVDGPITASTLPADLKVEFGKATPLWFYVLREAEVINGGARLGPIGSRIVAETLVGLVINDPKSYWHEGAGDGVWKPSVGGTSVESMEAFLQVAGVL